MEKPVKQPFMSGTVTPPDDLQPAIDALGPAGREHLIRLLVEAGNSNPTPDMLAKAADHDRGE
jgi:hypothetical protein